MNKLERQVMGAAVEVDSAPAAVFFSGGKDSIAATDLWLKYHKGERRFVYLYFVDGLEVVEKSLRYYEKRWNIKIDRRPCHETLSMTNGKQFKYSDTERAYLAETGFTWAVTGMKRNDSLARRGMFKSVDGIVDVHNRVHPVLNLTDRQVNAYCKINKLPLPVSYSHEGLRRSVWVPTPEMLLWLKGHFPGDYQKIISTFPQLELAAEKRFRGYR